MDEVINRATNSINQILETLSKSSSHYEHFATCESLKNTRYLLTKLCISNPSENIEWTRLFFRRLKRFLDYHEPLSVEFWIQLHDDIFYVLHEPNDAQKEGIKWKCFLENMKVEGKLEQRELQFNQSFKERKDLRYLLCEHTKFFKEYLDRCISLHSKVQVRGLIENVDDLRRIFQIEDVSITSEKQEKLKCIEIPCDCSKRSLYSLDSAFFKHDNSYTTVNSSPSYFLPSVEQKRLHKGNSLEIENVVVSNRWIVILGDPGSAKTTLLRWITRIFAEITYRYVEKIDLDRCIFRIPILIRIGEFAAWLKVDQTKTLLDYIGGHTWFSEYYYNDKDKNVLKELIYHGHALILLDGLDEIPEIEQRAMIVDLVRKFIDEYVRTPDFVSPFDDVTFISNLTRNTMNREIIELGSPIKNGGNQIIITSRVVGYSLYPLTGPTIEHYLILPMSHYEADKFIYEWMKQIEKAIREVLSPEIMVSVTKVMKIITSKTYEVVKVIFKNSRTLSMSNYLLMSLICTSIFKSSDEFSPKFRVEVYDHTFRTALRSWKNQNSNISDDILTDFLIDLATHLHLNSPSGLIDEFDMKHLCYSSLQQQNIFNNRKKLRKYADNIISLLDSNVGIIAERGLQVFCFLHLSFQEYLVAQRLIRRHSIDQVAERILSFTINPRFRESLLLAIGWISWKWSVEDYDRFCNLLVTSSKDYAIPVGALLFFDAINDLRRLPSNSVIFNALDSLLNYHCKLLARLYLPSNLSKLPQNIIQEWMKSRLNNETHLTKFCHCLIVTRENPDSILFCENEEEFFLMIYQQLWSRGNISHHLEIIMDQIRRKTIKLDNAFNNGFNKKLSLYFLTCNVSNIYQPLIFSVIIAIWGGIRLKNIEDIWKISFSPKHTHHTSKLLPPIDKYLVNTKDSDEVKLTTLIENYEHILQMSKAEDISIEIIDILIALICLQGLSQPLIYQKYYRYQALPLSLKRLKSIWFNLAQPNGTLPIPHNTCDQYFIKSSICPIVEMLFLQPNQFDKQCLSFLLACAAACKKLGYENPSNWLKHDIFRNKNIVEYLECQPEFFYVDTYDNSTLTRTKKNLQLMDNFQDKSFFLLTFIPQSLQPLYYWMIHQQIDSTDVSILIVLLSQCLITLEDLFDSREKSKDIILSLQPLINKYRFDNYTSALYSQFNIKLLKEWEKHIDVEFQRIEQVQNEEKDFKLFAALISIARLIQVQYRISKRLKIKMTSFSHIAIKLRSTIENIENKILRIIAAGMILDMKNPFIFDKKQRDEMISEIIDQLQSSLPNLTLLTSTLLFVQLYKVPHVSATSFQQITHIIGRKLIETNTNEQNEYFEAAFIALNELNNSDLSLYLLKFAERTENLSDLLQFNSTIFFQYFTGTTISDISNRIFLSSLYLTELAFDAQILNIFIESNHNNKISPMQEWTSLQRIDKDILTFEVAKWITNYLQKLNDMELCQIIEVVSRYATIENEALFEINKWLIYQDDRNKVLKFFALYAALQMLIENSNNSNLIVIIKQICDIDNGFHLKSIVERLINSTLVNVNVISEILFALNENIFYSSQISIQIHRKEVLNLILELEHNRIISVISRSFKESSNPFLSMAEYCSQDLQPYLVEYLQEFINTKNTIKHIVKEEYLTIVIKWIIEKAIWNCKKSNLTIELYRYIFILLHNQQFPQVQKTILNALSLVFTGKNICKEHIFVQDDAINHLEKFICSINDDSKDLLATSLFTYGYCLIKLSTYKTIRNVSNEIQNRLSILFNESSSEIISIRAGFCLIFLEHLNTNLYHILNWFEHKMNMTSEKKYNIYLQQTLYNANVCLSDQDINGLINHIKIYSPQLIDIFVNDIYKYLFNKCNNNYLSDFTPDYVNIALIFVKENFNVFHHTVKKTAFSKEEFGEEAFKHELYRYFCYFCNKNKFIDNIKLLELYTTFHVLTDELVKMLTWIGEHNKKQLWYYLENIKQVSGRNAVEDLFILLDLMAQKKKLNSFLNVLSLIVQLAQIHAVSMLEVHRLVSPLIEKVLLENNDQEWYIENEIMRHLSNLTCIENKPSWDVKIELSSESSIDQKFEEKILYFKRISGLFLRRNLLLSNFQ